MSSTFYKIVLEQIRVAGSRESLPLSSFPFLSLEKRIKDVTVPTGTTIQQQQNFHIAENNNTRINLHRHVVVTRYSKLREADFVVNFTLNFISMLFL